jgi:hypothetical protein
MVTATERNALELIKRLVDEWGEGGPVDQQEGYIWCQLCGADMLYSKKDSHAGNCLWLEILLVASEENTNE